MWPQQCLLLSGVHGFPWETEMSMMEMPKIEKSKTEKSGIDMSKIRDIHTVVGSDLVSWL